MIDFIKNNYQWFITTLLTLIGCGGTIYIIRKKNKQIIKNNSKGLQAGGDINLNIEIKKDDR